MLAHATSHCSGLDLERIQALYDLACNCPEYDPFDTNVICSVKQWSNPTCQQGIKATVMQEILLGTPTLSYEEGEERHSTQLLPGWPPF